MRSWLRIVVGSVLFVVIAPALVLLFLFGVGLIGYTVDHAREYSGIEIVSHLYGGVAAVCLVIAVVLSAAVALSAWMGGK